MTGEGLQILTYARHLWTLSSENSLACHTYCHTEHPDDPCHSHLVPSVLAVEQSLPGFTT